MFGFTLPGLECVAICTPPQAHFGAAAAGAGCRQAVLLEKPPASTTREIALLAAQAAKRERTLFQTLAFARFAAGVAPARTSGLRDAPLRSASIVWKEDVAYGIPASNGSGSRAVYGVFDPGINALSMLTEILPQEVAGELRAPEISREWPGADCRRPEVRTEDDIPIAAELELRHTGVQTWDIDLRDRRWKSQAIDGRQPAVHRRCRAGAGRSARRIRAPVRALRRSLPSRAIRECGSGARCSWLPTPSWSADARWWNPSSIRRGLD